MPDTLSNVVVEPETPTDLYAATGITVGTQINVKMIGIGQGKLYAGVSLAGEPDNSTGYRPIYKAEEKINDIGDSGAWIWSRRGCTVNVKEVV